MIPAVPNPSDASPQGAPPPPPVLKRPKLVSVSTPVDVLQVASRPPPGLAVIAHFLFSPNDACLSYLDNTGGEDRQLYLLDLKTLTTQAVLGPSFEGDQEVTFSLEEKMRRERQRNQFTGVTQYAWCRDAQEGAKIVLPLQGQWLCVTPFSQPASTVRVIVDKDPSGPAIDGNASPNGEYLAFCRKNDLYCTSTRALSAPTRLTFTGGDGVTNGLASFLAQEEMDRSHGFWWSPDSQWIAFEHVDERHIPAYRIVHQGSDKVGEDAQEDHRYPFAGKANPVVKLFVLDVEQAMRSGQSLLLELDLQVFGQEEIYMTRVEWFPDGSLAVQVENRAQTRLKLLRFLAGQTQGVCLLEETSDVWINLHDLFAPVCLDKKPEHFLWGSERDGFMHLYLYQIDPCVCIRQITTGPWVVEQIVAVDEETGLVYFHGNADHPLERHLYVADLHADFVSPRPPRLTPAGGTHQCVIDHHFRLVCVQRSSTSQPSAVTLCSLPAPGALKQAVQDTRGAPARVFDAGFGPQLDLEDPAVKSEFLVPVFEFPLRKRVLESLKTVLRPPRVLVTKAATGLLLFSHVYMPDPNIFGPGPYPTIVAVYGGPHVQRVKDEWAATADLRPQRFASMGFLVVKCDNRGSSRRGVEFESAIKGRLGQVEVEDQVSVVEALQSMGLASKDRVGVTGWSYGGYLAAMCLAKRGDVFKTAVAGAPVTSWDGYDSHYTERYMGTPETNVEGYSQASVMTHVSKITGQLMLVHGLIDENVHFRHSARLINSLITHRKRYQLLLFPQERHGPRSLDDRVYLEQGISDFFAETLLGL